MADAPFDLKWNINLRLAPNTGTVPAELRGRPVASTLCYGLATLKPDALTSIARSLCATQVLSGATCSRSSMCR